MDMYDGYWFSEPSVQLSPACTVPSTPCLSSPSSGYCSADEGHNPTPLGVHRNYSGHDLSVVLTGHGVVSAGGCGGVGQWQHGLLSADPCLGERIIGPPSVIRGVGEDGAGGGVRWPSVGFDDMVMDTFCDPFTGGPDAAPTRHHHLPDWTTNDTEMYIVDTGSSCLQQLHYQKHKRNLSQGGNFSQNLSASSAATSGNVSHPFDGFGLSAGLGAIGESSLVDLLRSNDDDNNNDVFGSSSSAADAASCASAAGSRHFDFAGYHQQHMAGMADMATGDADDYALQFAGGQMPPRGSLTAAAVASQTQAPSGAASGGRILGGVFAQRPSNGVSRVRSVAVAKSCGTLLQHSVLVPNSTAASAATHGASKTRGLHLTETTSAGPSTTGPSRVGGMRSSASSSRLSDVKGGRMTAPMTNPAYPGLDDHRYTLKVLPGSHQPPKKVQKTDKTSALSKSSSTSKLLSDRKTTSILELFLRSTRHMDPNKGSNAALAAEGQLMSQLRLGNLARNAIIDTDSDDDEKSGTLLKKLLTGEMDQDDVQRDRQREINDRTCNIISKSAAVDVTTKAAISESAAAVDDQTMKMVPSVNSILEDGFNFDNFDAELPLADDDSLAMLDDVTDDGDVLWMSVTGRDLDDVLMPNELDEILREQNRQDDLWLEHYVTQLL